MECMQPPDISSAALRLSATVISSLPGLLPEFSELLSCIRPFSRTWMESLWQVGSQASPNLPLSGAVWGRDPVDGHANGHDALHGI